MAQADRWSARIQRRDLRRVLVAPTTVVSVKCASGRDHELLRWPLAHDEKDYMRKLCPPRTKGKAIEYETTEALHSVGSKQNPRNENGESRMIVKVSFENESSVNREKGRVCVKSDLLFCLCVFSRSSHAP